MRTSYDALVVGAGIGGIRSALDLAVAGQKVALVDKRPSIGGILTQLDYQFPTDHCGMCKMLPLTERDSSSQFCMRKGLFHKNIDIYLSSELVGLEGDPGSFRAELKQHSSFVDPTKCIGCGLCAEVCPVELPSEFNAGLTTRSAIYLPVPHAIPNSFTVDLDNCQRCWKCFEECPNDAIDFMFDERLDFHILVADPSPATFEDFSEWLKRQNFPLHSTTTGNETIDRLTGSQEDRLLFLDLDLADPGADRVLLRSLELRPDLTVILLARPEQREQAEELLQQGAREVLYKPVDAKSFVPWLDKLYMRLVSDKTLEFDIGAVILAAGFECYDPSEMQDVLGYGVHPAVVTSLEFERMCSSSGPSRAKLERSDGTPVKKIAWLQCVGSRDLKKNADFCSSFCCMISIKEALLAQKITKGEAETTIFYMDMRTFGRDFQRYRDQAESSGGVRFVNSRIHSATPGENPAQVCIEYLDHENQRVQEEFDMLVLGVGARPPKSMQQLAQAAEVETNQWGFLKTEPFAPSRTTRLGVFAAGSCGSPKDIAESVIQSSAAALGASRLINLYAPLKEKKPEPEPEYRDVSRERPQTLVTLCTSCPIMEQRVDVQAMLQRLSRLTSVCDVATVTRACTEQGWKQIRDQAKKSRPNRLLIGACMPYAYVNKLRELGSEIKLKPVLMDVVDIYTPTVARYAEEERRSLEKEIFSTLSMAAVKLEGADPSPLPPPQEVVRKALIIGGGVAGMTAGLGIADHGYEVCLVEEQEELGGVARKLHYTLDGEDPVKLVEDLVVQVEKHPNITIFKDARVALTMGRAGKFMSIISTDQGGLPFEHGVTILATGAVAHRPDEYMLGRHEQVMTQLDLEARIEEDPAEIEKWHQVVMIQCVGSREPENPNCSRICCQTAIKNALRIKKVNPAAQVYILYRDIRTYAFQEDYYRQARKQGVKFIRYEPEDKPRVHAEGDGLSVTVLDPILGLRVEIPADSLVLSTGFVADDETTEDLAMLFHLSRTEDGYFLEDHVKLRPVDMAVRGFFTAGTANSPKTMRESITQAQ